jgi:hypothetical protein
MTGGGNVRLAVLLFLASATGFAGTWSGSLVDSKCFAASERNVNPTDTLTAVDRDQNQEIRYCTPGSKTRLFAVVDANGLSFVLDSAGNAKAVEFVRSAGKKSRIAVVVTGELTNRTITVDSISAPR